MQSAGPAPAAMATMTASSRISSIDQPFATDGCPLPAQHRRWQAAGRLREVPAAAEVAPAEVAPAEVAAAKVPAAEVASTEIPAAGIAVAVTAAVEDGG